MNRLVYPVSEDQFIDDARRSMTSRAVKCITGATYRVRAGDVIMELDGANELVTGVVNRDATTDPRQFRPLEIPGIVDSHINPGIAESTLRDRVEAWVKNTLAPVLAGSWHYVLEVVFPSGRLDVYTIINGRVTRHDDDVRWDVRCAVAASFLVEVIEGRRHWGDVLLGGMLRGCSRAYEIDSQKKLRPVALQPLFVYEAISYEGSVVRALEFELHN